MKTPIKLEFLHPLHGFAVKVSAFGSVIGAGSNFSYVTPYFVLDFGVELEQLLEPFFVAVPVGVPVIASRVYRNCVVVVKGRETTTYLIKVKM